MAASTVCGFLFADNFFFNGNTMNYEEKTLEAVDFIHNYNKF